MVLQDGLSVHWRALGRRRAVAGDIAIVYEIRATPSCLSSTSQRPIVNLSHPVTNKRTEKGESRSDVSIGLGFNSRRRLDDCGKAQLAYACAKKNREPPTVIFFTSRI